MTTEILIVALTLMLECRGEPFGGKVLIGEVIANRAHQSGTTPAKVCLATRQFSAWNKTSLKKAKRLIGTEGWEDCVIIATSISQPGYVPISPATHYYNPSKTSPPWARKMRRVAVSGSHAFFAPKGK